MLLVPWFFCSYWPSPGDLQVSVIPMFLPDKLTQWGSPAQLETKPLWPCASCFICILARVPKKTLCLHPLSFSIIVQAALASWKIFGLCDHLYCPHWDHIIELKFSLRSTATRQQRTWVKRKGWRKKPKNQLEQLRDVRFLLSQKNWSSKISSSGTLTVKDWRP